MRVLSVCSGIAADACAWSGLGWTHAGFAEIAAFPRRVLAERHPHIPLFGDFTTIGSEHVGAAIDLLVGGTPCQDFSVAGLRAGLEGANGGLALEYLRLAARLRPRWIVWENVPGVLSSDGGRAFGAFLGGLAELGYGFAWRVLDAQFFGVAQRRRRVFVVGHARGSWQRAAAVLFESSGLRWDPPPSRAPGSEVAGCLEARARSGGHDPGAHGAASGHLVAGPLKASDGRSGGGVDGAVAGHLIPIQDPRGRRLQNGSGIGEPGGPSYTIETHSPAVARTITAREGMRHREDAETLVFDTTQITHPENRSRCEPGGPAPERGRGTHPPAIAFHHEQDPISGPVAPERRRNGAGVSAAMVRRLTPRECERLQGFPDDYTAIPGAKDAPRYAALGNAIAVPVLRWIGERIAEVDGELHAEAAE